MKILITILLLVISIVSNAQRVELLSSGMKTSIRGLSVVSQRVIWVSGSNGHVGRSIDGGKTWKWMVVKGFEKRDFRDIEAFDAVTAVIIAVAEPGNILKTTDGGQSWKVVYENSTKGMFLDAMEFWNKESGIVIGDPIDGKFFVTRTFDGGETWKDILKENLPKADSGEACFAASGTNVRALARDEACFVSGGLRSRFFWKGEPIDIPIVQGAESTGANSVAVKDKKIIVVGGDFSHDSISTKNCFYTTDAGKTWIAPATPPFGYKSCVEFITKNKLIACGTSGVDVSEDGGKNWQHITKESFHVTRKAKEGNTVFLAGGNGKVGKLVW
ncbi:MAG TPA: hypothetical protein VJT83_02010 [Chitinophagaceae bacterium]|nr:hypothetical protein [Chitinophagaceae bacterium]